MLCVLKQWSQRLFERRQFSNERRGRIQNAAESNEAPGADFCQDPRELPRPARSFQSGKHLLGCYANNACEDEDSANTADVKNKCLGDSGQCSCLNCKTLPELAECTICLEPLQSQEIESCVICANLTCRNCAARLSSCAFCRSKMPLQRNRAVERLLDKLALPCRNSRFGCTALVNGDERFSHENACSYSTVACPVGRRACSWRGSVLDIGDHFRKDHRLLPITDHAVTVNIYNFRDKAIAKEGRQYTACLCCHDQLFVVKVVLYQGKLKLIFTQLGYTRPVSDKIQSMRYGVWVNVSTNGIHLKGVFLFGKADRGPREIEMASETFYTRKLPLGAEDLVKIEIVIKQFGPI